jgi:ABC-type sugar transport system ATPase subunit
VCDRRGSVVALFGENGAGKSTLMSILSGAQTPDAGVIELDGARFAPRSPREALSAGIALVAQELSPW